MAHNSYDTVAEKVFSDLEMAVRKDESINEFDVIPTSEAENRNSSPILKGENSLGLESWIIPHIYPFAHHQIMQKNNYKSQNLEKVVSCLMGVALLNPEMSTVWSRRRELILSRRMKPDNELRITRMALSRKPKSNEPLIHRRWIITEILKDIKDKADLLQEELTLTEMIANRYHSNYHAWSHRMWSLQHLLPDPHHWNFKKKLIKSNELHFSSNDQWNLFSNISKSKYLCVINSPVFRIFSDELENNLQWISSHVSDNSALHFRTFLINEIIEFLKVTLQSNSHFEFENEEETMMDLDLKSNFFPIRKINLIEFLQSTDSTFKKVIDKYLTTLDQKSNLFDLIITIVISELKSNSSLSSIYPGHEALWYYRRSLIHIFRHYVLENEFGPDHVAFSHQDKNGVPHRKDFKYDYGLKSDNLNSNPDASDLMFTFYICLIRNENEFILSALKSTDESDKKLLKNYEQWLKYCLKINEKSS